MLDPQLIRNELNSIAKALDKRGVSIDTNKIQKIEDKRKTIQIKTEKLQADRNLISKEIGEMKAKGEDTENLLEKVASNKNQLEKNEEELTAIQQELLEWKALRAQSLGIGGEINQDKKSGEIKSNATGVEINSGETTNEKKIEVLNSNDGEIANKKKTGAKVILMALLMALGWVASTHLGYEFKKVDKDDVDPESDDRIFAPTDANDDFLNKKIAELRREGKIVMQEKGKTLQGSSRQALHDPNAPYCNQFLVCEKNEWVVKGNEE